MRNCTLLLYLGHMPVLTPEVLAQSMSFEEYLQLTRDIVSEKVPRTGLYLNDSTFRYTRSNLERMNKVLEFMTLNQKLYNLVSDLERDWIWIVLTEPWCGDASWGTPALYVIASASEHIDFRILLRDQHPEVMKEYQTAGSDSIPKLICLRKSDGQVMGSWGPRPQVLQQLVMERKNKPDFDYKESVRAIHAWYDADGGAQIQAELTDLIKAWQKA